MRIELTEDQLAVQRMAREIAYEQVAPRARELGKKTEHPAEPGVRIGYRCAHS